MKVRRFHPRRLGERPTFIRAASAGGWHRPTLIGLLVATGLLYLWGLEESGWANSFYSAAAQAGSESWKAFFFGSSDAASSITVDKTPLALWPIDLSVRVFGLSSWSILVPQALEGVATVYLLYRIVRRSTGSDAAGLLAGAAMALTPVAVLMFRFNNPDAMLVLLLVAAGGATLRAVDESDLDTGRPLRWLLLAGGLVGLAFLAKMLQAFLVLPALGLTYLLLARTPLGKRLLHVIGAFAAMVLAGGWWVAIVALWPAASRPFIGGSQDNSILELTLGYNGFGRLTGDETGSVGGGAPGGGHGGGWGATGLGRMFNTEIGGQIAWLIPAALVLGGAALWFGRADRRIRAAVILWGATLLVTGLTFSLMAGIFHAYYTVALAPPVAALVGLGAWVLWRERHQVAARVVLAGSAAGTALWAFVLLDRTPDYLPWLRYVVLLAGFLAGALLAALTMLPRRAIGLVAALAVASALAAPAAYSLSTAGTPHTGSIPTAGPASVGGTGRPGGFGGTGRPGGFGGPPGIQPGMQAGTTGTTLTPPAGVGGPAGMGGTGNAGGLLTGSTPTSALTTLLETDAGSYTWVAAAVGSNSASGYQLATGKPVMAIGGFNGSDPSPTLAQFQAYVAAGRIHYFLAGGRMGGMGGMGGPGGGSGISTSTAISSWVEANFQATTVGGVTVYDLSGGAA